VVALPNVGAILSGRPSRGIVGEFPSPFWGEGQGEGGRFTIGGKMRKISVLLVVLTFIFCGTIFGAEGDVLWTRTYNGVDNGDDLSYGITVDENGDVYVTGYESVSGESYNIWVRKYDTNGYEVWTSTYNGTDNLSDRGYGIAVDGSGNVYVTGCETAPGQKTNIWVRKYDPDGNVVWTKTHNGPANWYDFGYGIAVDGSGNVYVTGEEYVAGELYDIWVRKYDSSGNEVWTRTYRGPVNQYDEGYGIAVDGNGNVYVTGYETVAGEGHNIWVRKYNADGNVVWTKTYNGVDNQDDEGRAIAVDRNGNVYVTGFEVVIGEDCNIWVRKYRSNGDIVWTRTYNGKDNYADIGYGIALDRSGNIYVTGQEMVTGEGANIWARKYDLDGNIVWTWTYNNEITNGNDCGYSITLDGSGNVYVTGNEDVSGEFYNIWVRKYEGAFGENFQPPQEGNVKIQGGEKGYVNPKKGEVAKIHFQPNASGTVNVKIYTLRGLLVWEKSKSVSEYQDFIEWDCRNEKNDLVASGIYAVYVEGPGIEATKKVAILK